MRTTTVIFPPGRKAREIAYPGVSQAKEQRRVSSSGQNLAFAVFIQSGPSPRLWKRHDPGSLKVHKVKHNALSWFSANPHGASRRCSEKEKQPGPGPPRGPWRGSWARLQGCAAGGSLSRRRGRVTVETAPCAQDAACGKKPLGCCAERHPRPPPHVPSDLGRLHWGWGQWTCVGAGPALDVRSGLAGSFIFTVMTGWPSALPGVSLLPTARPDVGRGLSPSGRHSSALLRERGGRGSLTGPRWALDASCLTGTHTPTRVCVSACSTSVPELWGTKAVTPLLGTSHAFQE